MAQIVAQHVKQGNMGPRKMPDHKSRVIPALLVNITPSKAPRNARRVLLVHIVTYLA